MRESAVASRGAESLNHDAGDRDDDAALSELRDRHRPRSRPSSRASTTAHSRLSTVRTLSVRSSASARPGSRTSQRGAPARGSGAGVTRGGSGRERPASAASGRASERASERAQQRARARAAAEDEDKSLFKRIYTRGDLPLYVNFAGATRQLQWQVAIPLLDYDYYLPVFFDGLKIDREPWCFLAEQGCLDLLRNGRDRVLHLVPRLVESIREALDTEIPMVMYRTMRVIRALVRSDSGVGEALVPYLRKLLGVLNKYYVRDVRVRESGATLPLRLADYIDGTLADLEHFGGEYAFVNIKYIVPTYETHEAE